MHHTDMCSNDREKNMTFAATITANGMMIPAFVVFKDTASRCKTNSEFNTYFIGRMYSYQKKT